MQMVIYQPTMGEYRLSLKLDKRDVAILDQLFIPGVYINMTHNTSSAFDVRLDQTRLAMKFTGGRLNHFTDILYLAYIDPDHTCKSKALTNNEAIAELQALRNNSKELKAVVDSNLILMDLKVKLT